MESTDDPNTLSSGHEHVNIPQNHIMHVLMMLGDDIIMSLLDRNLYVCLHKVPMVGKDGDDVLRILKEKASVSNMLICEMVDTLKNDMTVQNWIKNLQSQVNIPIILVRYGCNLARVFNTTSNTCRYTSIGHMQFLVENSNTINADRQINNVKSTSVVVAKGCDKVDGVVIANKVDDATVTSSNECVTKRKNNSSDNNSNTQVDMDCGINRTKRQRVVWTPELRKAFDDAVHELGFENAVPKKILEVMKWSGLTRENVASHLQKYRASMKSQQNTIPTQQNESTSRRRNKSNTNPTINNNNNNTTTTTTTVPFKLQDLPEPVILSTPQFNNIHKSDPISSCSLDNMIDASLMNDHDNTTDLISQGLWLDTPPARQSYHFHELEHNYGVASSGMNWPNNFDDVQDFGNLFNELVLQNDHQCHNNNTLQENNVCFNNVGDYQEKCVQGIERYTNVGNNVAQNGEESGLGGSYTTLSSVPNHVN